MCYEPSKKTVHGNCIDNNVCMWFILFYVSNKISLSDMTLFRSYHFFIKIIKVCKSQG